ncbi:hypothetical protein J6590_100793 [Homalodisca vitripennis]|nr:hypothetical protein J6590_100793 [Homalodisca vitripennis]
MGGPSVREYPTRRVSLADMNYSVLREPRRTDATQLPSKGLQVVGGGGLVWSDCNVKTVSVWGTLKAQGAGVWNDYKVKTVDVWVL